jgi:hypothetical protein
MEAIKGAVKSKTIGFGVAVMALGLLEQFTTLVPALVPQEYNGIAVAAIGLITAVLRWKTTKPLAEK